MSPTTTTKGPAFNRGERERLVADLGGKNAMILRNHGLLVCAPSIPQAFNLIYWLEQACKIQIDILSCGRRAACAAARGGGRARRTRFRGRRSRSTTRPAPIRTSSLAPRRARPDMVCWNGRRCRRRLDRLDPSYAD